MDIGNFVLGGEYIMFWLGLFVGANIGLIIASLLRAGKDDTDA